ncbi:Mog1p/PsbP-like protein [Peniophora sp. CONT]|nr:Mog1p/PsbP-like protein [Peniophora sp. CONT]
MSSKRDLFGGAITATLPTSLIDASDLRQIPDTQEVFLSPTSDVSIILEILESVPATDLIDAAKYHFNSLAHDNDATAATVLTVTTIPNDRGDGTPSPTVLSGTQQVRKFNRTNADDVRIYMAVYRVPGKSVDAVLTMNVPFVDQAQLDEARDVFNAAARSLAIVDYALFA